MSIKGIEGNVFRLRLINRDYRHTTPVKQRKRIF